MKQLSCDYLIGEIDSWHSRRGMSRSCYIRSIFSFMIGQSNDNSFVTQKKL